MKPIPTWREEMDGNGHFGVHNKIDYMQAEIEALRTRLAEVEKDAEIARMERYHARTHYDNAVRILTGIHALLYPPRFADHDGRTWQFKSPIAEEQMQELSDRIRALPDEIAAIDAAMEQA